MSVDDWRVCYRPDLLRFIYRLIKNKKSKDMATDEGMVAIVWGSNRAGLSVTLLPGRSYRNNNVLDMGVKTTRGCKSNVETNTEYIPKNSSKPAWDIQYDQRNHQFANYLGMPQFQEINEFVGNGRGEMESSSCNFRPRCCGRSSYRSPPQHMLSFMQSLRQYPKVTSSAEFVQKVLDNTYTKHHTKKFTSPKILLPKKSTSQHTHKAGKKHGNNGHKYNNKFGKYLDRSDSFLRKKCSSQEELLNYTYDYLKSSSLARHRTEIMYLTELKRALRDRLREIIESKPTVCPQIQSRYKLHKRQICGKLYTKEVASDNSETQVSPKESRIDKEHEISYSSTSLHQACFCRTPAPCDCKQYQKIWDEIQNWMNNIPVYANFNKEDKIKQVQMLKELTNTLKKGIQEPHFYIKAKEEILKFLKELPMWHPYYSREDTLFKENLANMLIDKMRKAIEAVFKEEISKEIENLPIEFKKIKREDLVKIIDQFLNRLKQFIVDHSHDEENYKEALELEIIDLMNSLPLKYEDLKPDVLSKVANKCAERVCKFKNVIPISKESKENLQEIDKINIENRINDICEDVQELLGLNYSVKNELFQFLKDKINEYIPNDLEDSETHQKLKNEIKEWLDNSTISKSIDTKTKDKLVEKIMQEIETNTIKTDHKNIIHMIETWVQGTPELADLQNSEKKDLSQFIKDKMSEYIPIKLVNRKVQQELKKEIKKWIDNPTIGISIDTNTIDKLAESIIKELHADTIKSHDADTIGVIKKLIQVIPELACLNFSQKKDLSQFVKDKMNEYIPAQLNTSGVQHKLYNDIKEWIDKSTISEGTDRKTKDKLAERIKQCINKSTITERIMQKLERDSIKNEDESTIDIINNWLQGVPELAEVNQLKNKEDLIDLATKIHEIQTSGEDFENIQIEIKETLKDWLHNILQTTKRKLSFTMQENVVNELVKNICEVPKYKIHSQRERRNMYEDVLELIKDVPGIGPNISTNQINAIEDLLSTLIYIINNYEEELVEIQAKSAINDFIEGLVDRAGSNPALISLKQRHILEKRLLTKMKQSMPQKKPEHKQNGCSSSTPKSYISRSSSQSPYLSLNLTPVRDVSLFDEHEETDEYMKTMNNLIENWIDQLKLSIDNSEKRILVGDIATDILDRHKYLKLSKRPTSEDEELEHLKYQVFRRLNNFNLKDLPRLISKINDLHKGLARIKALDLTNFRKRNINNLVSCIKTWFDNIPSDIMESHEKPHSDSEFTELAKDLAEHEGTINYYDMKKEIMLWLPKLFSNISTITLNKLADSLKKHLMNDIAQSMTQNMTAGLIYRQMLWDTISKTLPQIQITTSDDLDYFDLLKERLVDAFINLHYFTNDLIALEKFKAKLFTKVDKFCYEYLKRYPEPLIDSDEIAKNLYNALRQVSVPNIEIVKSELEQVRLKEDILDCISDLPLDSSRNRESEINAIAAGLAKRLYSLEKESYNDPNKDDEIKQEVTKWVQKLPLTNRKLINLQEFVDQLTEKLKSTDKSRTLSVSKIGKYDESIVPISRKSQLPESGFMKTISSRQAAENNIDKIIPVKKTLQYPDISDSKSTLTTLYDDKVSVIPRTLMYQESHKDSIQRTPQYTNIDDKKETSTSNPLHLLDTDDDKQLSIRRTSQDSENSDKITPTRIITQYLEDNHEQKNPISKTTPYSTCCDAKTSPIERTLEHPVSNDEKLPSLQNDHTSSEDKSSPTQSMDHRLKEHQRLLQQTTKEDDIIISSRQTIQYPEGKSKVSHVRSRDISEDRKTPYLDSRVNEKEPPIHRSTQSPSSSLTAEDRAHLDRIRRRVDRYHKNKNTLKDATVSPPRTEFGTQTEGNKENSLTRSSIYERGNQGMSPQVIIKEYYWDSTANISVADMTGNMQEQRLTSSPCSKVTQTTPQLTTKNTRTIATQTEQSDDTRTQMQADRSYDKKNEDTLDDSKCLRPPPCFFPEERKICQGYNLPFEVTEPRNRDKTCCNCGQNIYTKRRGRHRGIRQHCNLACLKYCVNCGNGCPYPSRLYFRKEF